MFQIDSRFEVLWREFNHELLSYIRGKVSNLHDAEDILQDVSIKIYKNVDLLQNPNAIKSWIYKITRNTIIDFYKKKKDLSVAPETLLFIEDEVNENNNMNDEIVSCLKHMLLDLPEKYKTVYDLYENKSMKHKDIVKELDISLSTSKVRLMRAKEIFKKNLVACCDFELDKYGNIINYKRAGKCLSCHKDEC